MRRASRQDPLELEEPSGYWFAARRPLEILALLLPLILGYELCLALVLPTGGGQTTTVEAHRRLLEVLSLLGVAPRVALFLGGVLLIAVLLVWQVLTRNRWRVDGTVVGLMAIESLVLAIPLLVLSFLIAGRAPVGGGAPDVPAAALATAAAVRSSIGDLDVLSRLAISVGAGLYEELLFRMTLIAIVHTLLVDVARLSSALGSAVAITVSAAAFCWYHGREIAPGGDLAWRRLVFYAVAGLYFGLVFTLRGFGVVVGAHALYDILVVLMPE